MKQPLHQLIFFFLIIATSSLVAQENYVDYNPQYKAWTEDYQLDKIEYTNNNTILHLRFSKENSKYNSPTFHPATGEFAWVLESEDGTVYPFSKLVNITKNGVVEITELGATSQTISALSKEKKAKTFFTCQLYFPRLSTALDSISLVEGKGYKNTRTHLTCLDIQLKNTSRGTLELEKERIVAFETPQKTTTKTPSLDLGNRYPYIDNLAELRATAKIDEAPSYKVSNTTFDVIIDKIAYTETETVFSVRVVFNDDSSIFIYTKTGEFPWVIIDKKNMTTYPLKMITNFCQDGVLLHKELVEPKYDFPTPANRKITFTCRVHFDKLPQGLKTVDLIEGLTEAKNKNHFNFFKIKVIP